MKRLKLDKNFIPCPVDDNDEMYPNGIFEFNVTKMIEFIRNNPGQVALEEVLVKDCWENLDLDESYVDSVDISMPVILAEIAPGQYNVIDGNHRVARARKIGVDILPAYRLRPEQHIRFLTSKKAYLAYIEYWNGKLGNIPKQGERQMGIDEKALNIWNAQPTDIRKKILNNVFCGQCHGAVTISDYSVTLCGQDIVLQGFCSVCGHKVARVVEGMAEVRPRKKKEPSDSLNPLAMPFLTDKQAAAVVNHIHKKMGLGARGFVNDQWARDRMRLMPLHDMCKKTREGKGLTIKEAAAQMKIKQYALKGMEDRPGVGINKEFLDRYIDFLGIREWFSGWLKVNQDVYDRLGEVTSGMNIIKPASAAGQAKALNRSRKKKVCQLKITLNETQPAIWRRIQVTDDITLKRLAAIILIVMGWTNSHLHQFHIGGKRYGMANDEMEEFDDYEIEDNFCLWDFSSEEISQFVFEYDFGDGWEHEVVLEEVSEAQKGTEYPICLDGSRRCPPEDCGGPGGYENFLKIIRTPNHQEYESTLEWAGGGFDSEEFNLEGVKKRLKYVDEEENAFEA